MNLTVLLREAGRALIDFLYPPVCVVCTTPTGADVFLCDDCTAGIESAARTHREPVRAIPGVETLHVLLPYDPTCRAIIHALKYRSAPSAGRFLGERIGRRIAGDVPADAIIVPVPLHPARLRERGYNQSEHIGRGIASSTGLTVDCSLLARIRNTGTQTALDADDRAANVADAFRFAGEHPLDGSPVILVDDVLTTGSTIAACAAVLSGSGAGPVWVCVAASPSER